MNPSLPHFPNFFHYTDQEFRHPTAQWCPVRRKWVQDGRILRDVKASKAFVWPKDGRNGTSWGRFKDILKNKGPDIYVTMNASKQDYMHNRPTRAQWSGHTNLDDIGLDSVYTFNSRRYGMPGGRSAGQRYDFRTRKYGITNRATWTDAVWQPEPRKNKYNVYPEAVRDIYGRWFQDSHYLPQDLGGPINNERGRGAWGHRYERFR